LRFGAARKRGSLDPNFFAEQRVGDQEMEHVIISSIVMLGSEEGGI